MRQIFNDGSKSSENDQNSKKYDKNDEEQPSSVVSKQKIIKKSSILKRKALWNPLSQSPSLRKLYLIGDMIVLNEDSVRNPIESRQSFIMNSLHFNRIYSIHVNHQYLALNLKRNQANYLTQRYMLDRFRSFNDSSFKDLADQVEDILTESEYVQQAIAEAQKRMGREQFFKKMTQIKAQQENMVEKVLRERYKDKKYIALYHSNGVKGLSLEKLYISTAMLAFTGNRLSQIVDTYTREKSLSFQLMGTSAYRDVFVTGSKETAQMMRKKRIENPNNAFQIELQDSIQISDFQMDMACEIYRKRHNQEVQWEEKLNCQMTFCKPLPSITLFLFGEAQSQPVAVFNKKSKKVCFLEFEREPDAFLEIERIKEKGQSLNIDAQVDG